MAVIFEIDRLKKEAQELKDILLKYKNRYPEAKSALKLLDPIIQKVLDGKITDPVPEDDIPCAYSFHEGTLREIDEMESAYATFAMHITGSDTDEGRKIFDEIMKEVEEEKGIKGPNI